MRCVRELSFSLSLLVSTMYNSVPYSIVQVFRLKCCSQFGGEAQQLAIRLVPMGGLFFCFGSGSGQPSIKRRLPQQKRIIFSQPSLFTRELVVVELAAASPKKTSPKKLCHFFELVELFDYHHHHHHHTFTLSIHHGYHHRQAAAETGR